MTTPDDFGYMFTRARPGGIGSYRIELGRMAALFDSVEDSEGIPAGKHAARATRDVIRLLDGAERLADLHGDLWYVAERYESCKCSHADLLEALAKFGRYEPGDCR